MRLFRTIACLAFVAASLSGAAAEVPGSDVRAFMEKSGLVTQLSDAADQIREMFAEQIAGQIPTDLIEPMGDVLAKAWDADRFRDAVEKGFAATLAPEELAAVSSFIETELGQRLMAAETEGGSKEATREIEMRQAELLASLQADKPRMAIAERVEKILNDTEMTVAVATSLVRAIVIGSAGDAAREEQVRQVDQILKTLRPQVVEDTRISMLAGFAYEYRDFSLGELTTYAEFLETNPSKAINSVLFAVANEHFIEVGEEIGEAMATLRRQKRS
jgi:hypothetical protein